MFLILVLSTLSSGTDYAFSQLISENVESTPKSFTINLVDGVGIKEPNKQSDKSKLHNISLQEKIGVLSESSDQEFILIKYDSNRKIMMERIFDRQSKFKINESKKLQTSFLDIIQLNSNDLIFRDHNLLFDKFDFKIINNISNIFEQDHSISNFIISPEINFNNNNIELINDQIFDPNNPIFLILLIPLAGFVLIRYDNEQIKFHQIKQFFTLIFVAILVSSAVITPVSISSSYWGGYAFAELDNATEIIPVSEFELNIILQGNTTTTDVNDISELDFPNIFSSGPFSINPNHEMSISDVLSVSLTQFLATPFNPSDLPTTNSYTSISDVLSITLSTSTNNGTSTTSNFFTTNSYTSISDVLSVNLNSTGSTIFDPSNFLTTNSTISISDELEIIFMPGFSIDNATLSLTFDSLENTTSSDDAQITEDNSLQLDGDQDFIQLNNNSTNNLESLVVGAWIKPDYSQGSQEFTVVSKANSFSLSVDNQISSHAAKFSIFDGIKWTNVNSISDIPEEWTYLTASFSNQTISIYVNGELVGTNQLDGVSAISLDGILESVDIESISSENDIVVGAYITTKSGLPHPNNMFSGMIDDVILFDYMLSGTQMAQLYSEGLSSHETIPTKTLDEILNEIEEEMQIKAQNGTSDALQAQISLSDTLSYIHSQALNATSDTPQVQNGTSDALQAQISLSDTLSYIHSQALNGNSTSLLVANATPILTPMKETYSMAEDAEIIFEFYNESEAMAVELENLDETLDSAETDTEIALDESGSVLDDLLELPILSIPEADAAKDDVKSIKAEIKNLKKQIKQFKQNETVSKTDLDTIKNKIKLLIDEIKDEVRESTKQKKIDKLNKAITKLEKITNKVNVQKDNWNNNKETIVAEIYDANNNKVELDLTFEKQREGKFNIKIDPSTAKPGIYKIKTTLTIDGTQFTTESQFAWGLVSINTFKSIYKPQETAELVVVVLNSTGGPVCDANIVLDIIDPNLSSTLFTTPNEIPQTSDCGLYYVNYPTTITGNHTVNVEAETETGITNFSTHFTVQESFDYDIIRDTPSKIDPFYDSNNIDVSISVKSFVGSNPLTIREYVPASFEIVSDATVEIVNNTKILTWIVIPENDLVTVDYVYSVPLITPELYTLGPVEVEQQGTPLFTEARPWFIAVDPLIEIFTTLDGNESSHQDSARRTVTVNATHMYSFYLDSGDDIAYHHSVDGGANWSNDGKLEADPSSLNIDRGVGVWYDQWTPGRSGEVIHITTFNSTNDGMFYFQFNADTNTVNNRVNLLSSIDDTCTGCMGTLGAQNDLAITVGTDGVIYTGTVDKSLPTNLVIDHAVIKQCDSSTLDCNDSDNWSNAGTRTSPYSNAENGNDGLVLLPLADGDIMLVSHEEGSDAQGSPNDLRYKIWDGLNWSGSWTDIVTNVVDNTAYEHTLSGLVTPDHELFVTVVDDAGVANSSEIRAYHYDGSWNTLDEPFSDSDDGTSIIGDADISRDNSTGYLYASYIRGSALNSMEAYYKISTNDGASWGTEHQLSDGSEPAGEWQGISATMMSNYSLRLDIFVDGDNDFLSDFIVRKILQSDTAAVSDEITLQTSLSINLDETLAVSDVIDPFKGESITLDETLAVSDDIDIVAQLSSVTLTETLSVSDEIDPTDLFEFTLDETVAVSDVIGTQKFNAGSDPNARPTSVRVINGTYDNGNPTQDFSISPSLDSIDKAFTICSFRHATSNDHDGTYKAWELTSTSNLRIHASTSGTPADADFTCNIIEFTNDAVVDSHLSTFTKSSGGATQHTNTIGQTIDPTQTMEWFQGHTHDASDTNIGKEELERVRITSSTQWEWTIQNNPNSGDQEIYMGLVDWNNNDVSVQRGLTSIASSSANKTLTSDTDFNSVDRSRSLLFVTFYKGDDGPNSYAQDTTYVRATIQPDGDLTFARAASDTFPINIAWTLVELPEDYANVRHGIHHQDSGTSNDTFTLDDPIVDTTREFAISTVCTPFGCGGGTSDTINAGVVSDVSATIVVEDANTVRVQRGGSVGNFDIGYQVIEFLPKKVSLDDTVTISDTISTIKVAEVTLDETLSISDEITGVLMALVTLTETLDISDVLTTNKVGSVTLDETLDISDVLTTTQSSTVTLDETLNVSDVLTTTQSSTVTLDETLNVSDALTTTRSSTVTLDETLDISDILTTSASSTVNLDETLNASDILTTTQSTSVTLDETLNAFDILTTSRSSAVNLDETLNASDILTTSRSSAVNLDETLNASDILTTTKSASVTLDETLNVSDVLTTTQSSTVTLDETLNASDILTTTKSASVTLDETLNASDILTTTKSASVTLDETLNASDILTTTKSASVTLDETLGLSDILTTTKSASVTLDETLSLSDSFTFDGVFFIRADNNGSPVAGATYLITPNPITGSGSLTVTDGLDNDSDVTPGIVGITGAPFGDYEIEITIPPTTYTPLVSQTIIAVWGADISPQVIFTLVGGVNANSGQLDPIEVGTAPLLNEISYETVTGLNAIIVNESQIVLSDIDDLPEIIGLGEDNTSALPDAITQQSNLKLEIDITPGLEGIAIQDIFNMPTYALPEFEELTVILPATVTDENTTHQVICSPSMTKIIPGQTMIIPVEDNLIPSFGGVSQLSLTSDISSSSVGTFDNDFTCIEVDDEIVNNPTLASSGITNVVELFIDVKYRFEEDGTGFDWNTETNFENPGVLDVLIPIPTASDIITLENGCSDIEVHTLVGSTWTSGIDRVVSNEPSVDNPGFCEAEIESDHYSKKSVSSKRSSSGPGSSSSGSSGSSGGGRTGIGAGYSGASFGFGGFMLSPLAINEVSYDKCSENMARIIVSSDAPAVPVVKLHTAKSGTIFATLAQVQPYAELNKLTDIDRYVYETPISAEESFLMIVVTEEKGTTTHTVQTSVKLLACEGTTVFVPLPDEELPPLSEDAPRIFDTKLQIGDSSYGVDESEFLYLDGEELLISTIIDSEHLLQSVELRSISLGQTVDQYVSLTMDVAPLYISNSTYIATVSLPSYFVSEPGMTYWLHITDVDGLQTEYSHYNIGVKPIESSSVNVEVDMPTIRPSGSIVKPEFYIFNEDVPSYGIVSLMVDGKVVSKQSQLFGVGQTHVIFNWNVPNSDVYVDYEIQGMVELYDNTFATSSSILATHPKTVTVSGTEMPELQVVERDGTILADPALVYASNADDSVRFMVTDPQGQCIIGSTDECLVNDSTRDNRGGLESIPYGDQILRVRYSGADNALERFSITSIDPIVGQWNVTLETEDDYVQQAHAAEDVVVKIKYRYHSETVTAFSK